MECSVVDVKTVITELRTGQDFTGTHHETFGMRPEQAVAVNKTHAYFHSIWKEDMHAVPRFLWNAKMRFGKTFAAYQLAKKLGATKVLVVTFKPAVEDAWQTRPGVPRRLRRLAVPLEGHGHRPHHCRQEAPARLLRLVPGPARQGQGRQHQAQERVASRNQLGPRGLRRVPLRRLAGHREGALRGRGRVGVQEGTEGTSSTLDLEGFNEELDELGENESEFLPITTKAYLYLSGTPFKALATGEFIEEQIFNWTYTDEQRAKRRWSDEHPGQAEPLRRAAGDAAAHLPDARRAARDRQPGRVRRVRP